MITVNKGKIKISCKTFEFEISTVDSRVLSFVEKYENRNIINNEKEVYFLNLFDRTRNKTYPKNVLCDGDVLSFSFEGLNDIRVKCEDCGEYITFEILEELERTVYAVSYANTEIDKGLAGDFGIFSYAITENVDELMYPNAEDGASRARAFRKFGVKGAKVAVVGDKKANHRDILKKIHEGLKPTDRVVSKIGGPYAFDYRKNSDGYIIVGDTDEKLLPEWIEFYNKCGVTQLDFHQGPNTFRQGDFYFHKYGGSATEFGEKFAKPLSKAGILSGLHTYAYYIDRSCDPIMSNPEYQKQIRVYGKYKLAVDVSPDAEEISTVEATDKFDTNHTFFALSSPFILIDEEIMQVEPLERGFKVKRACCGTKKAEHKAGTVIKHLEGKFCMFCPEPGSELFYKIARDTAKAYNDGKFEMIYLDALDGIGYHCDKDDEAWYYASTFVAEIVKHCNTSPIIEYSTMYYSMWPERGRMGALDTPFRGYKEFVKLHVKGNREWIKKYYRTTLGWYIMYPVMENPLPRNYAMRYQFEDDIDFVGTQSVAYDSSMVYLQLTIDNYNKFPALRRNVANYERYLKVRPSVSDDTKKKLAENKFEAALVNVDGRDVFVERSYSKNKIYDMREGAEAEFNNPFEKQAPIVRIEGKLTSGESDGIVLVKLDGTKDVAENQYTCTPVDIRENLALRVRVTGNGKKGSAVVIRLSASKNNAKGIADYICRTDFVGTRDVILAEVDNGEYPEYSVDMGRDFYNYSYYRSIVNYDCVDGVRVMTVGDTSGVKIGDIVAVKHEDIPTKDITLSSGADKITFNTELLSSEYIEYCPKTKKAYKYDYYGNSTEVATSGTMPEIANGDRLLIKGENAKGIPSRCTLKLGFSGNII